MFQYSLKNTYTYSLHFVTLKMLIKEKYAAEILLKLNLDVFSPCSVLNALNLLMLHCQLVMSLDYPFVNPGSCLDLNEAGCLILSLKLLSTETGSSPAISNNYP